jgi:hypothetical protein
MTAVPTAAELLAVVERSPRATEAHDKSAWVNLFTEDGRVEDPYGSRPHTGPAQIAKFYDTFIAPRAITFLRDVDIVFGTSVIRDLTLQIDMGSAVVLTIPAILRYDLAGGEDGWRIARLRAYWELPGMFRQFLGNGAKALPAARRLAADLLANQRLAGTVGFLAGFRAAGTRGKRLVADAFPEGKWDKMIAAGNTVAASGTGPRGRTVAFAEIERGAIHNVEYFAEGATDPA